MCVPISGSRAKRIILTPQYFRRRIRAPWQGWDSVRFEDRGTPHTTEDTLVLADDLRLEWRFLPIATPELNARDHLGRHTQRDVLANAPVRLVDTSADAACQSLLDLSPQQRLKKAGILSGNFWLA